MTEINDRQSFHSLSDDDLVSTKVFAELIGVKETTISYWISTKRYDIPFLKIGSLRRHRVSDLRKILKEGIAK